MYEYAASAGLLGEASQVKYEKQKSNEALGLASGRQDFFEGIFGALERPFFGYGSYAEDETDIRGRFAETFGLPPPARIDRGMPGHSHIIGAWLFAGALSLPFWIYFLSVLIGYLTRDAVSDHGMMAYGAVVSLSTIWTVLFSPFSNRPELAAIIAFALVLRRNYPTPSHRLRTPLVNHFTPIR